MNDQSKKNFLIIGGAVVLIALIVVLFIVIGGPSCKVVEKLDGAPELKDIKGFSADKSQFKIDAVFHVPKTDKDKDKFLVLALNDVKLDKDKWTFKGDCAKDVTFEVKTDEAGKTTISKIKATIENSNLNEGKEFTCEAQIASGLNMFVEKDKAFVCNKAIEVDCLKDNTSVGKLEIRRLNFKLGEKPENLDGKEEDANVCNVK